MKRNYNPIARYRKENPICERCGRRIGVEVHHIVPVIAGGTDDPGNLEALCGDCHAHAHISDRGTLISKGMNARKGSYSMNRMSRYELYVWLNEYAENFDAGDLDACGILDLIDRIPFWNGEYMTETEMKRRFWNVYGLKNDVKA